MASENILVLNAATFDSAIASGYTLVDFWATWCRPCIMLAPLVDQIADEYQGKIAVAKVDIDENSGVAARYGIMSIPTLVLFKDGKPVDKTVGVIPKAEITAMIDKNIA